MKLPRWDCRSAADQKRLEAWTNARLDEAGDDMPIDESYAVATEKHFGQVLKRGRLLVAVKAKDKKTVARLADTEELRLLALQQRGRGRAPGDRRPNDLPEVERWACQEAVDDMERIRLIWQHDFGKRNRSADPTANDIAARRYNIEPDILINYRKNRRRKSR
jgi:hypothetical protein